ncbi:MAG: molybdopterin molybdotransferase MoeA [Gemmobacter sp.]|uniref:molybdopterin molybdotransferase MoeA n=1 Tax=Gemmobacter sp. TaxID=1898957 RepID=UPI001A546F0D|nr:molybdopterin molybdotransferase MoeA [Gemmobacter sp.]MBL8563885.1 molybdopterin molybdotransferase MoeA [Gemmobacter sp.]
MISVAEALERVLALARPLPVETVPLAAAAGRWLAEPLGARLTQPPFDASAMDGYAIAGPAPAGAAFTVIGEAGAGHAFDGSLGPGEAVRIFTGAPVPDGASHVALQEDVSRADARITLTAPADKTNIRHRGDDFAIGQMVTPRRLRPQDLALLAAMNLDHLPLRRRPEVAILTTGDELVMPGEQPRADQIVASNGFALKALIEGVGGIARLLPIARDTEASLRAAFTLTEGADVVVTIGGASVGDHDVVARLAPDLGLDLAFHKIAMRPGKPLIAGNFRGTPLLGLPGNPVSAFTCAHLFLLPLLRAMQGDPAPAPQMKLARLACDTGPTGPRAHYMRAHVENGVITPFQRQDSALLSVLCEANALLLRPLGDGPRAVGDEVEYLPV